MDKHFISYLDSKTTWELVWEVIPTPPIHPRNMRGKQTFSTMKDALTFFNKAPEGAKLISLTQIVEERKDFTGFALEFNRKMKRVLS